MTMTMTTNNNTNKYSSIFFALLLSILLSSQSSLAVLRGGQGEDEQDAAAAMEINDNDNDNNSMQYVLNGRTLLAGNYTSVLDEDHVDFTRDGTVAHASGDHFSRQMTVFHPNFAGPGNDAGKVFDVGTPHYGGTGCPGYSVDVVPEWGGDSGTITILFHEYVAMTSGPRSTRSRKSCNLALPIKVEPGISVGIYKVDYRGFAFVAPGRQNYAQFDAEYFFAGAQGPRQKRVYGRDGPFALNEYYEDDFFASDRVGAIVWTGCGKTDFHFRINTALAARKRRGEEMDTEIGLDTVDIVEDGFQYHISLRRC